MAAIVETPEERFRAAQQQFRERIEAAERRVLTMQLERERERAFFKMAVDALRTFRNLARTGQGRDWTIETEVVGHIEQVLRHTEDIANGKAKP